MPATRNSTSRYTNHHHHNHHHDGMAPKDESEASASSASSAPDPFTNDIRVPASQWPVLALGTVVFLPVRAVLVVLVLVLSWALAVVGTAGLSDRHIETKVMTGWRRKLARAYSYFGLLCFYAGGFRVKVVGRRAPRSEAPLLVGAPHSSFLEALVVVMCESSPVSRHENKTAFLIAACQRFYQTIFVDRQVYIHGSAAGCLCYFKTYLLGLFAKRKKEKLQLRVNISLLFPQEVVGVPAAGGADDKRPREVQGGLAPDLHLPGGD